MSQKYIPDMPHIWPKTNLNATLAGRSSQSRVTRNPYDKTVSFYQEELELMIRIRKFIKEILCSITVHSKHVKRNFTYAGFNL